MEEWGFSSPPLLIPGGVVVVLEKESACFLKISVDPRKFKF